MRTYTVKLRKKDRGHQVEAYSEEEALLNVLKSGKVLEEPLFIEIECQGDVVWEIDDSSFLSHFLTQHGLRVRRVLEVSV